MAIRLLSSESIDGTLTLTGNLTGTNASFTRLDINATNTKLKGDLLGNADAAYDIGALGANRPRNLFLSNSIQAADATFTGSVTASNFIGTLPGGPFLPLTGGTLTGNLTIEGNLAMDYYNITQVNELEFDGYGRKISAGSLGFIFSGGKATFEPISTVSFIITNSGNDLRLISGVPSGVTWIGKPVQYYASEYSFSTDVTGVGGYSQQFVIENNGDVGIGVSSPIKKLQVSDFETGDLINILCVNRRDQNGDTASIGFSMTDNNLYNKAAVIFERTTTQGRGSLHFATNNTNSSANVSKGDARMTILTGGNVGIGTTSPQRPLHVNGTEGAVRFTSTASGNSGFEVGIGTASQAFLWQTENSYMHFATNSVERMRISSLGVVSVGTTSPITDPFVSSNQFQQFQVGKSGVMGSYTTAAQEAMFSNNMYVGSTYNTFQALDTSVNATAMFLYNDYIAFKCGTTAANGTVAVPEQMRIDSSGAVGIDNSSPASFNGSGSTSSSLVIGKGTSNISPQLTLWQGNSAQATINFASANTGTGQYEGRIRYTRDTGVMDFRTNGVANALVLGSTGDVLINRTARANGYDSGFKTLSVASNLDEKASILELIGTRSEGGNQNGMIQFYTDRVTLTQTADITGLTGTGTNGYLAGELSFSTKTTSGSLTERMRITSAGDVNILNATATDSKSIGITNAGGTTGWTFGNGITAAAHQFVIYDNTAGLERMRISSNGLATFKKNIELDSTTPTVSLEGRNSGNSGAAIQFLGWNGVYKNWKISTADAGAGTLNFRVTSSGGGDSGWATVGTINESTGAYTASSDINRKKDLEDSKIGLKEVMELQPKLFRMKTESKDTDKHLGFIAQEVKEVIPQAYFEDGKDNKKFIGLTEMPIIAALTKAIQELKAEIEILKKK